MNETHVCELGGPPITLRVTWCRECGRRYKWSGTYWVRDHPIRDPDTEARYAAAIELVRGLSEATRGCVADCLGDLASELRNEQDADTDAVVEAVTLFLTRH